MAYDQHHSPPRPGHRSGHRARKRFGQNFLHDPGIIQKIVLAIDPRPGEQLVEIGPGLGALTSHLLRLAGSMDVIELDRDLVAKLHQQFGHLGKLHIHSGDALKFDFRQLVRNGKLRLVGNLPYNISTPLLFHLLSQVDVIQDMYFMLQKEVVQRMAADPGTSSYGRLSIMVQYYCHVEQLFNVPPGAFNPPPKVDSSIVRLQPHHPLPCPADDLASLSLLLRQVFSKRRKTLRNGLKGLLTEQDIVDLGIDPELRPEVLGLKDFVALSNRLHQISQQTSDDD
ncbi:MAG: 16S rRNA (adenine(1518)-N(6)/adenine(1519)-N(6)) -dimethyltransferase RsmA [Gammaproteobacteria bacterium]|nr:MAG: 16S rRNA (adenine(1518)-N(6)/adenine(1519)-N(6)) -dimethyltransferase RsmA [Gammaproteobacteria bacterium]